MSGSLPESVGLRERRERTIASLCDHFAQDRLTLDEFETRLDLAHKALAQPQLDALIADIHVAEPVRSAAPQTHTQVAPPRAAGEDDDRFILSVMSGNERRGNWRPGAKNTVLAFMGGVVLDFRDTPLPPGVTEINIFALMGGCEIIVPPNLAVETRGFALMGGFSHFSDHAPPAAGSPVLRITGFALMGGVDISVRLPGETARDARRRLKDDRRRLRDSR